MLDRDEDWPSPLSAFFEPITVDSERLDELMARKNIESIDLLKIDVEGNSYEVIKGFGERIKDVKCIHIENEHAQVWKNQRVFSDVEKILIENNFILVSIKIGWPQTDSVWIQKDLYNPIWWGTHDQYEHIL